MKPRHVAHLVTVALMCCSAPLFAEIRLATVVRGLSAPVFVGHAGDGTNRLFVVEQRGAIKVLRPGSSTPTTFLDIQTKVLSGGEQGLLGLAFHPRYFWNGRFFVYYVDKSGNRQLSEFSVSDEDPNVADADSERAAQFAL